jgi:hypothetical protein
MIRKAFDVSVEAHKDQRRKSGEAIFSIPLPAKLSPQIDWSNIYRRCIIA